jgi:hypothetical protein
VLEHGDVRRADNAGPRLRRPTVRARDFENQTGQKSAQQVAIDEGAELIRRSRNWRELHTALASNGMRLEKKGSGAVLWVGETAVTASVAGRDCSMSALTKRLGAFEAASPALDPAHRVPEAVAPGISRWDTFIAERQRHYLARSHARESLRKRERDAWGDLEERHRCERRELLGGSWRRRGEMLNALRSVLAAGQAQEKAALRERQQLERSTLRERFPHWPTFEEWLRVRGSPELAERWRFRERTAAMVIGDPPHSARPRDIRAFVGEAHRWEVRYRRAGMPAGAPCFSDRGREILIHDLGRDSVLAALQLSAQKWGSFQVFGSEAYKRRCVELAAEHRFRIANPELQAAIAETREQRQRSQTQTLTPPVGAAAREPVRDVVEAYRRHLEDLRRERRHADAHASRLDEMVAVRLRATGHTREQVERAIREGAALLRPHERRDLAAYARRTVAHAFGVSGEREFQRLGAFRAALYGVEGRTGRDEPSLGIPPRRRGPHLGM